MYPEVAFDGDGRPLDAGFYTGAPAFHNVLYKVYLQLKSLGAVAGERPSTPTTNWLKKEVMSNRIFEELSEFQYEELIKRLNGLASHPAASTNSATQKMLLAFQTNQSNRLLADSLKHVHSDGPVQTVGRRKTSTAVVQVWPGSGTVTVNKRPLVEYFSRPEDRQQVLYPLLLTKALDEYDIVVFVGGGGLTGMCAGIPLVILFEVVHLVIVLMAQVRLGLFD